MQAKAYPTTDPGWPLVVPTPARIVIYLVLMVVVSFEIYAGWQGALISNMARETTGTSVGDVTGAFQSAINQTYFGTYGALGFFTWFIGMTGFFGISLGVYFLSGLALIGAVPKWWARAAVLVAWILVSVAWQYADLIQQLGYLLD